MIKPILTTIAVTAACGIMACAPARSPQADLALIQNQLDASNKGLARLSQQVALIQILVDTHQRTLQTFKSPENAGAEPQLPSVAPEDDEATFTHVQPPQPAIAGFAPSEGSEETPRMPLAAPGEESVPAAPELEPARVTGTAPLDPPASEIPKASPPAQIQPLPMPTTLPEEESPQASEGDNLPTVNAPNPFYEDAMDIFRSGDYESAAALFEAFVEKFPEDNLSDNALYWAGECKYTKKKFSEAIHRFKRVVEEYPVGSKVPDALLKIGFAYISLGDMESAETYLKQLIAQYPFSSAGAKAEERLKAIQKQ